MKNDKNESHNFLKLEHTNVYPEQEQLLNFYKYP